MGKVTNASSVTSGYMVVGANHSYSSDLTDIFPNSSYTTSASLSCWHYSTAWLNSQPDSGSVNARTSEIPLYVLVRKLYSVAFLYKSGSGGAYTYSVGAGVSITTPTPSAPTGYTFAGWSSSWNNGGQINNEYYNGDSVSVKGKTYITVNSDLTYYAVYTPNTYEIKLDSAYYSSSSATSGTAATTKGTENIYVLYQVYYYKDSNCSTEWSPSYFTAPTYTGYTFGGYYTGKAGTGTQILTAAGACTDAAWTDAYFLTNPTLYAKWTINTYTLTVRYYRQYVTNSTNIKVTQSSCIVTDNYSTTTDGILSCGSTGSTSSTYYAKVAHTYSTSSYTVTIARQNTSYDYYMNATTSSSTIPTTSSSTNSITYSWKPTSNTTIYVNVYQEMSCMVRYYRLCVSGTSAETQIEVTQSSCIVTDNYSTTTDGILSCGSTSVGFGDGSESTTYYATLSCIYSTLSYTITIARQNTSYTYYMNATTSNATIPTMSSETNSATYSWEPTSNATIYVNVFQRVACELKAEYNVTNTTGIAVTTSIGYLSGDSLSETSTIYLYYTFSSESATINLSRQNASYNYNILCGGTTKINSNSFDLSLRYGWGAAHITVYQRYTITYNGNGYTSGTVPSTQYKIHGTSLTLSSNSLTKKNYSANGWNTAKAYKSTPDYTTTYSVNADATLYANFKRTNVENTLKYDSTNNYYYFEDGYMPQTYAEMISSGLNASITNNGSLVGAYTLENGTTYKLASYSGYYYLGFTAPKTMSLALESYTTSGTYSFTKGTWYWFRFEPIRWKVSKDKWDCFDSYGTNYTVVSDLVLWYDCMDTNENHKEGDKAYDMSFTSSLTNGNFETMLSTFATNFTDGKLMYSGSNSAEWQKFGETKQANPVQIDTTNTSSSYSLTNTNKYTSGSTSSLRVASTDEISDTVGNTKAKASCLVAFLMGSSNNQYSKYWTRDLGNNLNAGKVVAQNGLTRSEWLSNSNGIRFAYTMSEGVNLI